MIYKASFQKWYLKKNYNIGLAKLSDKKMYNFAKQMFFDEKALSKRNTRSKYFIGLHKSPGIMTEQWKKLNTALGVY